jgi:hypothetical protein
MNTEFLNLLKSPEEGQDGKEKNRKDEQLELQYINTWKCHNETPCLAVLHKQNVFFQKLKKRKMK